MMEADNGKLFIGGISWDTNEDRLKEYFGTFGEIVEAVIMRDRTTGRARGFGFVVFSDPVVAEKVVQEKHIIDGRTVEAKKAVPRDDQQLISQNSGSIQGSPGAGPTKKIFVGGLASTVTESDFKTYFDEFGTITDVVVMYDHNTQRPRGFGFITFDSEEAVEKVLQKTFHELNGKMVEVKRAVPKEMSPGPTRSPVIGYNNYGINRANFLNSYNLASLGSYGMRIDGRYNPLASARAGFSQFSSPAYGLGMNMDQGLNSGFGAGPNFSSSVGYGRVPQDQYNNHQNRYSTPIGYNASSNRGDSMLSPSRNLWGIGGPNTSSPSNNNSSSGSYFASGNVGFGVFGDNATNWGTSPIPASVVRGNSSGYREVENNYAVGSGAFGRNGGMGVGSGRGYEGPSANFYRGGGGSIHADSNWLANSSDLDNSGSFGYGLGNSDDVTAKESEDYGVSYDIQNRKLNREIAT